MSKSTSGYDGFRVGAKVGSQALDIFGAFPSTATSKSSQTYSQVKKSTTTSSSTLAANMANSLSAQSTVGTLAQISTGRQQVPPRGSNTNAMATEMQRMKPDPFLEALEMAAGPEDGFVRMHGAMGMAK